MLCNWGSFAFPCFWGHLAMSGAAAVGGDAGVYKWVEARDATRHAAMHNTAPHSTELYG